MLTALPPPWRQLLFACLLACSLSAAAAPDVILSTSVGPPLTTPEHDGFLDRVMAEAFRRTGGQVRIVAIDSSERALINANNGIDDGVVPRIKGLDETYTNLVRVPEKVFDNDFVAMALHVEFATRSWDALAPYQLAYMIGWKIFDQNLAGKPNVTQVKNSSQLFGLLEQGRADVALYERWQGLWQARSRGLPIRIMEPALARTEMFCYLHRKHAALVPRIAAALAEMKRDGSYQRIYDETLTHLARGTKSK